MPGSEIAAEVSRKEAIDERIGGRIEWRQTLNESSNGDHRLRFRDVTVDLEQVEDDVRCPAQNEHKDNNECHFDGFDFSAWDDATRAGPSTFLILVQHGRSCASARPINTGCVVVVAIGGRHG